MGGKERKGYEDWTGKGEEEMKGNDIRADQCRVEQSRAVEGGNGVLQCLLGEGLDGAVGDGRVVDAPQPAPAHVVAGPRRVAGRLAGAARRGALRVYRTAARRAHLDADPVQHALPQRACAHGAQLELRLDGVLSVFEVSDARRHGAPQRRLQVAVFAGARQAAHPVADGQLDDEVAHEPHGDVHVRVQAHFSPVVERAEKMRVEEEVTWSSRVQSCMNPWWAF